MVSVIEFMLCTCPPTRLRRLSIAGALLSKPSAARRLLSVQVADQPPNLIDAIKAKIDTGQGKHIHARWLGIVERVFSNICVQKHLDRFTLRSNEKVDVQWRLFALVHNIGKIHTYGTVH